MTDFGSWALLERESVLQPATLAAYNRQLVFAQRQGLDLDGLTVDTARAYMVRRVRDGATPFGRYLDAKALNLALEYRFGERPFRKPKLPRSVPQYLEHAELQRVMAWRPAGHPEVVALARAFLFVEFALGTRLSEVAALDLGDVDAVKSRIHVRHPAKGGRRRWCPVPASVFSERRPLMAWLRVRPQPVGDDSDALWTTRFFRGYVQPARRCAPSLLDAMMKEASEAVGVHVTCTVARHTVGFRLRRAGWDLLTIKDFLGHQSVKSTEVYANDPTDLDRQMKRRPPKDMYQE